MSRPLRWVLHQAKRDLIRRWRVRRSGGINEGVDPIKPRHLGEKVRLVIRHPPGTNLPTSNGRKIYKGIEIINPSAGLQGPS